MDPIKDTVEKTKETVMQYKMVDPGDRVIIAVSGGPDSICMLDVLNSLTEELGISLLVAHYNHGLRKDEDEAETDLVKDAAGSIGVPIEIERAHHLSSNDSSIEEKAREARYTFLENVREKHKAQKIAMGHNRNDQAETVLIRLLRGSGPSGLSGIPPVRDNRIIRPLIEIKRKEIMSYLAARELPYAIDSSNQDIRHLRNRIRLELLPMMQDYQPQLIDQLCRFSDILRDEDAFMESLASDWVNREAEEDAEGNISLLLSPFKKLPGPLRNRVSRYLLRKIGSNLRRIEYDHILSVSGLVDSEKSQTMIDLPNGITIRKTYERLEFISGADRTFKEYSFVLDGPGVFYVEAIKRNIILEELEGEIDRFGEADETKAYLDADKIRYPLILRNIRPGDRFVPLGMKGHKKVKDFFIDQKVPSRNRAIIPILMSQDTPVWICGYRIDDRFKVTTRTEKILKVFIS